MLRAGVGHDAAGDRILDVANNSDIIIIISAAAVVVDQSDVVCVAGHM